jgi:hypothetical protein
MDVLLWVGGPKDGQPVTAEDMAAMAQNHKARYTAYDALLQERDALKAALRALVDNGKDIEPVFWDGDGDARCCYCGNYPEPPWGHEPDCPVAKARELLKAVA